MSRLYRGFDIITNRVHTSNQQRQIYLCSKKPVPFPIFKLGSVRLPIPGCGGLDIRQPVNLRYSH